MEQQKIEAIYIPEDIVLLEYKVAQIKQKEGAFEEEENQPDWESLGIPAPKNHSNKSDKYQVDFIWRKKTYFKYDIKSVEEYTDDKTIISVFGEPQDHIIKMKFADALKLIYSLEIKKENE